jgi:hypothetical protein
MDVWLWDATGPDGEYAGVCGDEGRALGIAGDLLAGGLAGNARVERADAHIGGMWIKSGYSRTGSGLTAVRATDGTVTWTRFFRPALAAS